MDTPERRACSARRSNGEPCRKPPIKGGTVCSTHGGQAPQVKAAAKRRVAAAQASLAVQRFGLDQEVDPADALLGEVARTAGMARWLGEQVAAMADLDVVPSPEFAAWQAERQHLARVSKAALDAGVEARRVALAEDQAERLAAAIMAVVTGLGLDEEQRAAAISIVRQQLTALGA